MLATPAEDFEPTLPGLFAGEPSAEFVPLLDEIAADVRAESLETQLMQMAEADRDCWRWAPQPTRATRTVQRGRAQVLPRSPTAPGLSLC
jgi:hypothetical protein